MTAEHDCIWQTAKRPRYGDVKLKKKTSIRLIRKSKTQVSRPSPVYNVF